MTPRAGYYTAIQSNQCSYDPRMSLFSGDPKKAKHEGGELKKWENIIRLGADEGDHKTSSRRLEPELLRASGMCLTGSPGVDELEEPNPGGVPVSMCGEFAGGSKRELEDSKRDALGRSAAVKKNPCWGMTCASTRGIEEDPMASPFGRDQPQLGALTRIRGPMRGYSWGWLAHVLAQTGRLVAHLGQTSQAGVGLLSIAGVLLGKLALLKGTPGSSTEFTRDGPTSNTKREKRIEGGGKEGGSSRELLQTATPMAKQICCTGDEAEADSSVGECNPIAESAEQECIQGRPSRVVRIDTRHARGDNTAGYVGNQYVVWVYYDLVDQCRCRACRHESHRQSCAIRKMERAYQYRLAQQGAEWGEVDAQQTWRPAPGGWWVCLHGTVGWNCPWRPRGWSWPLTRGRRRASYRRLAAATGRAWTDLNPMWWPFVYVCSSLWSQDLRSRQRRAMFGLGGESPV
ncbi:hypothetical protein AG1IA_07338 [Rhizoctonia solani AG-1 IA]|uniref:Uncharacterized protein n=1 Tax=Thanatephorus cucumeris (strain AG1-IA) TaxID=983506 RepID=L8WPC7_THACA|nr:hypothetical protein AG1IA_07338 [Rhizoctonia solani AG-1 IA]